MIVQLGEKKVLGLSPGPSSLWAVFCYYLYV